jgi:hypothetical protein
MTKANGLVSKMSKCSCEYSDQGKLVATHGCMWHEVGYKVDERIKTKCTEYRPIRAVPSIKPDGFVWPRCQCGEIAQEH